MLRFRSFFYRRRYGDLNVSIREHLQEKIEELMEEGMSREDATSAARREFGNVALIEEQSREVWQQTFFQHFLADLKFAWRQAVRLPRFTIAAMLTLAIGIACGASMTVLILGGGSSIALAVARSARRLRPVAAR